MLRRTPVPCIIFLGKDLAPVDASKDLGVVIDKHLSFNDHTSALISDLFGKLCAISRIHHLLELPSLICTVNTIVFSKLFYCSSVCAGTSYENIARLQLVENFAARILFGKRKFEEKERREKQGKPRRVIYKLFECSHNIPSGLSRR